MKTMTFIAFMALGLMGCAFQSGIVAASDDNIDIKAGQYTNPGADAAKHCAQYGKEAMFPVSPCWTTGPD